MKLIFIISFNIILALLLIFFLQHNLDYLFYGLDGNFMRLLTYTQSEWNPSSFGLGINYLQSLGNITFPVNLKFIPGFYVLSKNIESLVIPAYLIFSIELFLSALLTSKILGLNKDIQIISGWLLVSLMIPISGLPVLDEIMSLAPQTSLLMLLSIITIYMFSIINKYSFINNLFYILIVFFIYSYILVAIPLLLILLVPLHFLFFSYYFSLNKINFGILVILLIFITFTFDIHFYVLGLFIDTAAYINSSTFINTRMSSNFTSVLFNSTAGFILIFSSLLGSILYIIQTKNNSFISYIYLIYESFILIAGYLTTQFSFWQGPSLIYFEWLILPFSICFSLFFFINIINFINKKFNINSNIFFSILLTLAILVFFSTKKNKITENFIFNNSEIITFLERETKITPNSSFAGRVATFTGIKSEINTSWPSLHYQDYLRRQVTGNEHRDVGLWNYGIPTLWEYSPSISPFYFNFIQKYLATANVAQQRNTVVFDKIDPKILGLLGVKYIISDRVLSGFVRVAQNTHSTFPLFLYKIDYANINGYSPTNIVNKFFSSDDINKSDLKETLYTNFTIDQDIVKVKNSAITLSDKGIKLTAQSDGYSIILLPFEFSNCMSVAINNDKDKFLNIFRADYLLTGVYFYKNVDINITYKYSIFENSKCKYLDFIDYKKISN